jgi:phage tail-like protein
MSTERAAGHISQFRFRVTLGPDLDRSPDAGFVEVSGLGTETEVKERRNESTGDDDGIRIPATYKARHITLKRGLVASSDTLEWFREAADGGTAAARTVRIDLVAEDGDSHVASWELVNARPVRIVGATTAGPAGETAIEELVLLVEALDGA